MKKLKHLLLLCLFCMISLGANAEEIPNDEIWYTSSNGNVVAPYRSTVFGADIVSNTYANGKGIIKFDGNVTSIGDDAFCFCSGLTSFEIPNSVTSIGSSAFYGCSGLTSVTIPNSVTSIEDYAFELCLGLTSVTISNLVTAIGTGAFEGCLGLTNVTIPNSVTSIGSSAFYGCSGLTSVTIPNSVTSIGNKAFYGCSGLTSVTIPNSVPSIGEEAFCHCSGLTSFEIPNSVTSIGDRAFQYCSGLKSVTIPNSVTSIGGTAFQYCPGLTSIAVESGNTAYDSRNDCNAIIETKSNTLICGCKNTIIPNSVTSIGSDAFNYCSALTSVTIPNSITSIGSGAFCGCSGLASIVVESSNTVYDSRNDCNAIIETKSNKLILGCNNTTIPDAVTEIGSCAFLNCSGLTSVIIPNSVTSIGECAFSGCSGLISVTIPNSVTSIGSDAFYGCTSLPIIDNIRYADTYLVRAVDNTLSTYKIKEGTQWIGNFAFYDCSGLTSIEIPNSVISIEDNAFGGCTSLPVIDNIRYADTYLVGAVDNTLSTYKIKEDTKWIGSNAFNNCKNLTSIEIPNSVTSIGDRAFQYCSGLTSVYVGWKDVDKIPHIDGGAFPYSTCDLYVPFGTKALYSSAGEWKNFKNIIEDEPTTPFYAKYVEANFGKQMVLPIYLNNDESVCGFQFDIELPEGFSIATSGRKATYVISAGKERFAGLDHTVTSSLQEDGSVRVLCSSITNANINDDCKDAPVINITINVDASVAPADYMVKLKNITLARFVDGPIEVNLPDAYSTITVLNAFPVTATSSNDAWGTTEITGDNYDSETGNAVIGTDVTLTATPANGYAFVNWTENGEEVSAENPLTFTVNEERNLVAVFTMLGDVYENNVVNVTDLSATVGIILNRTTPTRREYVAANIDNDDKIDVADYSNIAAIILNGGISAAKSDDFTKYVINMQYDMHIPAGLKLNADDIATALRQTALAKNHSIVTYELENGDVRVLVLSMQNEEIADAKAMLEEIAMPADKATGEYDVTLRNIVLSYSDLSKEEVSMMNQKLMLTSPTGITSYENDNENDNIYNLIGQKLQKATNGINIIDGKKYIIK